jgi:hypothetical protein
MCIKTLDEMDEEDPDDDIGASRVAGSINSPLENGNIGIKEPSVP